MEAVLTTRASDLGALGRQALIREIEARIAFLADDDHPATDPPEPGHSAPQCGVGAGGDALED
jgi:hypothetical protein